MLLRSYLLIALFLAIQTPFLAQAGSTQVELCRLGFVEVVTIDANGEVTEAQYEGCDCLAWVVPIGVSSTAVVQATAAYVHFDSAARTPLNLCPSIRGPPALS